MPQTREHILLARQVNVPLDRRLPQQVRPRRRPGAARPRRARGPRAAQQVRLPGRRRADHPRLGDQGDRGRQGVGREDRGAVRRARHLHPGAGARNRQAVPDAGRGRVLDHGPRHGGHGPYRARQDQGRRGSRDGRLRHRQEDGRDRRRDVPQAARRRPGGRQRRPPAPRRRQEGDRARHGAREAGLDHAAHEVRGRGLRPDEGRGRPPHAVLQGLPPAVLLPHDGRDGRDRAAGRHGDGDAGRQHPDDDRADHADRHGRAAALRHPRRRPHGRRGRRDEDSRSKQ